MITISSRHLPNKQNLLLILCLLIFVSVPTLIAFGQKGKYELWFKSDGQLISYPPERLYSGDRIVAKINMDENFWANRTTTSLNFWLKTLETLKKDPDPDLPFTFGNGRFPDVQAEMAYRIKQFINSTAYIPTEQKQYYLKRLEMMGLKMLTSEPAKGTALMPSLEELIVPEYYMEYRFFDKQGARIDTDGNPYCTGKNITQQFAPCENKTAITVYMTQDITIPVDCYEVKYSFRLKNNTAVAMMKWAVEASVVLPQNYPALVAEIEKAFGNDFPKQLETHKAELETLGKNPADTSINLKKIFEFVSKNENSISSLVGRLSNPLENNLYKKWVAHWLWLTGGVPQMNPFGASVSIFPDKPAAKLSAQEKALYEVFETMTSKGALKITELGQIDTGFKNIPRIKAAIDAEAGQQANDPLLQDKLLYEGILKTSSDGSTFMRHLDVLNNYVIMGIDPVKEISEEQRMYIMAENKIVPTKLSIAFETTAIATESSWVTNETDKSGADRPWTAVVEINSPSNRDSLRRDSVLAIKPRFKVMAEKAVALRALPQVPSLPIYFERDESPDYISENLEHDYLYDAPAFASYTVKQINPDKTEKDVVKGTYRINKLYHFRLKAGLVYSFLQKKNFTEISQGLYTLDNPVSGIDGTFGIQYYFREQDIRSKRVQLRSFVYVGLSMKKITENFYVGVGIEPLCGLAFGINGHIGQRETLTGTAGFPTGIKSTWGINIAPCILIDPVLFVRLFSFGNTNKTLIGF